MEWHKKINVKILCPKCRRDDFNVVVADYKSATLECKSCKHSFESEQGKLSKLDLQRIIHENISRR